MPKKLTQEEFIQKAKLIHGDKYDYSLVEYKNARSKIKIIYNGIIYEQKPSIHIEGGRPEKANESKTTEQFIIEAKRMHGEKYDYSLAKYNGIKQTIDIIYNGIIYKQNASSHLSGCCPEIKNKVRNNKQFIKEAKLIHGEKYNYSMVDYKNNRTKVKIIYNGFIYEQTPENHLKGFKPEIKTSSYSKGEDKIKNILEKYKITYEKEKTFDNCKNLNKLPFDFYLINLNCLIEFDGKQHFENIKFFGGKLGLIKRQKNDEIKNIFCAKNRIPLLRVSYLDKNIEELIINFIKINIFPTSTSHIN